MFNFQLIQINYDISLTKYPEICRLCQYQAKQNDRLLFQNSEFIILFVEMKI